MTSIRRKTWSRPIRAIAALAFVLAGGGGVSAQQRTFDLASPAARIFSAGPGMVLAVHEDMMGADFVDLRSGDVTRSVRFDGELKSAAPFTTGKGLTSFAFVTGNDSDASLSVLEGGTLRLVAPDAIPGEFVAPTVLAVGELEGSTTLVVWDKDWTGTVQFYRRIVDGRVEDVGLKVPYYDFLNFGDGMLLGLQPMYEVAELLVDGDAQDSIFLPDLSFDTPRNLATFVPDADHGGNGKVAIANSDSGILSVLTKEEARLPRIGLPTQVPFRAGPSSTGGRLLLVGSPDLSLILVAEEGAREMASYREIDTRSITTRGMKPKGAPSGGGGLQDGNPFELEAPLRDAVLGSTGEGDPQFVFLTGDGTTLVTAMVDAVSSAVDVSVDPAADIPFTAGSQDVESVMRLQKALASLGYSIGAIDGMVGPATNGAIRSFQVSMGLDASGNFDEATAAVLNVTLDDTEFSSADDALAYFSPARLAKTIGDDPARYRHVAILVPALFEGGYRNRNVLAALLANVIYETSNLRVFEESKAMAERLYEGRANLGNTQPGDGERFRGRGYLMIVGRFNYERYAKLIGADLVNEPDLALDPEIGAKIAVSIFQNLVPADSLDSSYVNLSAIRKRVTGAMNGIENVVQLYGSLLEDNAAQ